MSRHYPGNNRVRRIIGTPRSIARSKPDHLPEGLFGLSEPGEHTHGKAAQLCNVFVAMWRPGSSIAFFMVLPSSANALSSRRQARHHSVKARSSASGSMRIRSRSSRTRWAPRSGPARRQAHLRHPLPAPDRNVQQDFANLRQITQVLIERQLPPIAHLLGARDRAQTPFCHGLAPRKCYFRAPFLPQNQLNACFVLRL